MIELKIKEYADGWEWDEYYNSTGTVTQVNFRCSLNADQVKERLKDFILMLDERKIKSSIQTSKQDSRLQTSQAGEIVLQTS